MLDSKPTEQMERRTGSERRFATDAGTPPTGDGAIVLDFVDGKLAHMLDLSRKVALPILNPDNIVALREDLFERANMGRAKYGTFLRVNNGRKAVVDLYQETLDAIMYCGQARMEGDAEASNFFELLISIGSQLARIINKRTA